MRKIVLKTALVTLGVVIVLAVAAFGIASLCIPATMSELTYSLGMDLISSDYAYQEYERSGDLAYLSRSFELAAANGRDQKAEKRFDELYAADGFDEMCAQRDAQTPPVVVGGEEITYSYRDYVCGLGACVKYRLADSDEEQFRMDAPDGILARLEALRRTATKPLVAIVDGGVQFEPLRRALRERNIPTFPVCDRAVAALSLYMDGRLAAEGLRCSCPWEARQH